MQVHSYSVIYCTLIEIQKGSWLRGSPYIGVQTHVWTWQRFDKFHNALER